MEKPHVAKAAMEPRMLYLSALNSRDGDVKYDDDDDKYEPNMKRIKMKNEDEHDESDDTDGGQRKTASFETLNPQAN